MIVNHTLLLETCSVSSSCAKLLRKLMAYIYESEQVFSSNSSLKSISVTVGGVLCGGPLMMSLLVSTRFCGPFRDEATLNVSLLIASILWHTT